MVPAATHAVGARVGLLVGHTLSGSRQPVMFDVTEGSRTSRPPAVLVTGTLGSGKTMTAQLLALHGFAGGSRIIDLCTEGTTGSHPCSATSTSNRSGLTADEADRGMLDPLRIGPEDLRVELAYSFLTELLPSPVPAEWQTEIRELCRIKSAPTPPSPLFPSGKRGIVFVRSWPRSSRRTTVGECVLSASPGGR